MCVCVCWLHADLDKIVAKTDGYSGSDMKNLIQEACQGPVRAAVKSHGEAVAGLRDADLRPVSVERFLGGGGGGCCERRGPRWLAVLCGV